MGGFFGGKIVEKYRSSVLVRVNLLGSDTGQGREQHTERQQTKQACQLFIMNASEIRNYFLLTPNET